MMSCSAICHSAILIACECELWYGFGGLNNFFCGKVVAIQCRLPWTSVYNNVML